MQRKMTRLARAGKCGAFGASGASFGRARGRHRRQAGEGQVAEPGGGRLAAASRRENEGMERRCIGHRPLGAPGQSCSRWRTALVDRLSSGTGTPRWRTAPGRTPSRPPSRRAAGARSSPVGRVAASRNRSAAACSSSVGGPAERPQVRRAGPASLVAVGLASSRLGGRLGLRGSRTGCSSGRAPAPARSSSPARRSTRLGSAKSNSGERRPGSWSRTTGR